MAELDIVAYECNGICLHASEIGMPLAGNPVAYAHPDCELHSGGCDEDDEDGRTDESHAREWNAVDGAR